MKNDDEHTFKHGDMAGMKLGEISIARTMVGDHEDYITIQLTRPGELKGLFKIEMNLADFALAITGRSSIKCAYRASVSEQEKSDG